mgnify:CR=1 FL=1
MEFGITENYGMFRDYAFILDDYVEVWYDRDSVEFIEIVAWYVEDNVLWLELEKNPKDGWKDFAVDVRDKDEEMIDYIFYGTKEVF